MMLQQISCEFQMYTSIDIFRWFPLSYPENCYDHFRKNIIMITWVTHVTNIFFLRVFNTNSNSHHAFVRYPSKIVQQNVSFMLSNYSIGKVQYLDLNHFDNCNRLPHLIYAQDCYNHLYGTNNIFILPCLLQSSPLTY